MKKDRENISQAYSRFTAWLSVWFSGLPCAAHGGRLMVLLAFTGIFSLSAAAQTWTWTYEMIDVSGKVPSLAVDSSSNLHIAYMDGDGALKYGFRPAGAAKWYTMVIDRQLSTFAAKLTLDPQNNPQVCYTPGSIKYASFDGRQWRIVQVAKGSGDIGYTCSIAIAKDGTPHLTWYQVSGPTPNYLHMRYAVLKDNAWLARTLDLDNETGKWNSMVLDAHGDPLIAYSAWYSGEMRLARWTGKQWDFTTVDSRSRGHGENNIGQGNSLILDSDGNPHLSFYSEKALKYAHLVGGQWKVEVVDDFTWFGSWAHFRSTIVLDKRGFPHICYENAGFLKHAYWDGKQWHLQVLARNGLESIRYGAMAIDQNDNLYVAFREAEDYTLKLAIGRPVTDRQETATKAEEKRDVPQKKD